MRTACLLLAALSTPVMAGEMSGAEVYQSTCIECHGSGKLNAPRLGDQKRWKKLIGEGLDDIIPSAFKGIRKMPAKGGNPALSDLEVARGAIHMANASGGKLAEPTTNDTLRWRKIADQKR